MEEILGALAIGVAGGVAGGLLGIGGGTLYVPALVLLLGVEQQLAQGISLAAVIPTAISATTANLRRGYVDGRLVATVTPAALVLAVVGARIAGELDSDTLSRIFGVVVLYVGVRTLFSLWRQARSTRAQAAQHASEETD
ncbi:MAG: sulfite exporter TauE/SafE family protein [Chloroflexi bacterium]|nr:sulfite exporter TauE/SafE family protein [Chloroflexota bacterium]